MGKKLLTLRVGKIQYDYMNCQIRLRKVGGFWLGMNEAEEGQSDHIQALRDSLGEKSISNLILKNISQGEGEEVPISFFGLCHFRYGGQFWSSAFRMKELD